MSSPFQRFLNVARTLSCVYCTELTKVLFVAYSLLIISHCSKYGPVTCAGKKQEMLVKTGAWYHGGMAKPVQLDVDTGSDTSSH